MYVCVCVCVRVCVCMDIKTCFMTSTVEIFQLCRSHLCSFQT